MPSSADAELLPDLPTEGEEPWLPDREAFDNEVKRRIEGYLSPDALETFFGDIVGGLLAQGANVSLDRNEETGVITISATGGSGGEGGPVSWGDILLKPNAFVPEIGPGANQAVAGNDARLTNQRVPTANSVDNTKVADGALSQIKIANLGTTLAAKADLVGGVLATSQLPALAISKKLGVVASQAAMLALVGEEGDYALRSDTQSTWIISGNNPADINSWTQLYTPTDVVLSVNGQIGVIVLNATDVGAVPAGSAMLLTGAQTIAGIKTFTDAPVVPNNAFSIAKINGLQTELTSIHAELDTKADSLIVLEVGGSSAGIPTGVVFFRKTS